ncbi:MAG: carboxypeptidase-like regulatory domain-containing protein [Kofleriaceae bacterium]
MVLAFVAAAGLGWVARGVTLNTADAAPAIARKPVACPNPEAVAAVAALTTPPAAADEAEAADDDPTPDPDDESAGDDIGALLAKAHDAAVIHNGVHGLVTDQATGSPLPGVTVLLMLPGGGGAQTAVTDGDGEYAFADLEAGTYTVNFYYINSIAEHPNVTVNSFDSVLVSERMDSTQVRRNYDEEGEEGEYIYELE